MDDIVLLSNGLLCCLVCADKKLSEEEVEERTNGINIAGTSHGWKIYENITVYSDQENGCNCEDHPETRRHYLLEC